MFDQKGNIPSGSPNYSVLEHHKQTKVFIARVLDVIPLQVVTFVLQLTSLTFL